jgi:hypothetical protein
MNLKQQISRLKSLNLPKSEKQITRIREYTIIDIEYEDHTRSLHRVNIGFTAYELLGLLEHVRLDLHQQFTHPEQFKTVTRKGEHNTKFNIKKKDEAI